MKNLVANAFILLAKAHRKIFSGVQANTQLNFANRFIRMAYKLDNRNALATYRYGLIHAHAEDWTEALNAYQDTLESRTSPPSSFYHHYGMALINVSTPSMAKQAFEMSLHHIPDAYWSYFELGMIFFREQKFKSAEKCFRQVIQLTADHDWVYLYLAHSLVAQDFEKNSDEVIDLYIEFAKRQPNNPAPYHQLRNFLFLVPSKHKLLADQLEEIIQQNPDCEFPYWMLGWIKSAQFQPARGMAYFKKVFAVRHKQKNVQYADILNPESKTISPQFVILGLLKSGTTSLFHWLEQHPNFIPPLQKEARFLNYYFECGFKWYREQFPRVQNQDGLITGEASPGYIYCANRAKSFKEEFPDIKLILLHRNPIERAYSEYQMRRRNGTESRSWGEAAVSEIKERGNELPELSTDFSIEKGYLARSCTLLPLQQWLEVFPKEQFLLIKSEALFKDPAAVVNGVCDFLEISHFEAPSYIPHNKGAYSKKIEPEIVERLEAYFRPHEEALGHFVQEMELNVIGDFLK
ncbi:MAG: sulfotransferase domain-containing protein [Chloroflexota bacterium]